MGDDEVVGLLASNDKSISESLNHTDERNTPEASGDDDSKMSSCSSNSEKNWSRPKKRKEGYEESAVNIEKQDNEIFDIHMSDDYGDEDESILNFSDCEDSLDRQIQKDLDLNSKRKKPLEPLDIHYKCEWKNCSYETDDDSKFHVHVSYHIPDLEIKTLGNGDEVYVCLWAECNFLTGGVKEIQRHVTYHSYHTKLKYIGAKLIEEWDLPKCMYGTETRNMIPEKIDSMVCEWKDCNKEFNNIQVFLHHTQMHANEGFLDGGAKKENIRCKWEGCTKTGNFQSRTRLTEHFRSHTKEKLVGCPSCGHLFASNTKLDDHCKRQLPNELSDFQCCHCYKRFPSLRLLKGHTRGHVNFYKCCYCDMTCSSRFTFSAHIRYKHLDSKPFKCSLCEYTCKTQNDLKNHLASHDSKAQFECEEVGCKYTCRSKRTLQRHMVDYHQISTTPIYCCHLPGCKSKYRRGGYLTKHLMTKHCLRWPSGHSKFMYHRQEDGTYRLQTVRYESVKLYKEYTKAVISPSKSHFKVSPVPGSDSRSFRVSPIETDSSSEVSQVFISIEDESGNTINCGTAPEFVGDKIPKNATIIASADSLTSENADSENNSKSSTIIADADSLTSENSSTIIASADSLTSENAENENNSKNSTTIASVDSLTSENTESGNNSKNSTTIASADITLTSENAESGNNSKNATIIASADSLTSENTEFVNNVS